MTQSPECLLVLGATSEIGGELASRIASGRHVVLAAQRPDALGSLRQRLKEAGALSVHSLLFDATEISSHRRICTAAEDLTGAPITRAIVCFGVLGNQERAEEDEQHACHIATVDYTAQIAALTVLAQVMRRGRIVVFSSIAGWRARRLNYVYGSTKAGLDAFCQGLADRLDFSSRNIQLITVRPGFVIGRMTKGMKPAPLSLTASQVADRVAPVVESNLRSSRTLWAPPTLALLAAAMRLVPRPVWRRMPR